MSLSPQVRYARWEAAAVLLESAVVLLSPPQMDPHRAVRLEWASMLEDDGGVRRVLDTMAALAHDEAACAWKTVRPG